MAFCPLDIFTACKLSSLSTRRRPLSDLPVPPGEESSNLPYTSQGIMSSGRIQGHNGYNPQNLTQAGTDPETRQSIETLEENRDCTVETRVSDTERKGRIEQRSERGDMKMILEMEASTITRFHYSARCNTRTLHSSMIHHL
jgi:hypothetical protein